MPRKNQHEATDAMYTAWKNSRPVVPVPFKYKSKGVGKIEQTWKDIKDGLNRDSTSYALSFSTSHIAPSITQANVLQELAVKDEKTAKRNRQLQDEKEAESIARGESVASSSAASASGAMFANRRNFLTDVEQETLEQSEGGGRGRVAFLKERNKLPINVRFGGMARTSNQMYGHAQLNNDHRDDLLDYCRDVQRTSKGVSLPELQRRPPQAGKFVSEFVPAEVARQSQIPPEFAALGARPNKSIPYALSIIDGPGSNKGGGNDGSSNVGDGSVASDAEAAVELASQAAAEKRQSEQHRHARGDFRKRTFQANSKVATGIFPKSEWM